MHILIIFRIYLHQKNTSNYVTRKKSYKKYRILTSGKNTKSVTGYKIEASTKKVFGIKIHNKITKSLSYESIYLFRQTTIHLLNHSAIEAYIILWWQNCKIILINFRQCAEWHDLKRLSLIWTTHQGVTNLNHTKACTTQQTLEYHRILIVSKEFTDQGL